ncbi:hypothetical protein ZWY2020_002593 [Hordeum vulgare]|nr:hypothetical protein ZWY2020_002593 [Hordeum vulgare]
MTGVMEPVAAKGAGKYRRVEPEEEEELDEAEWERRAEAALYFYSNPDACERRTTRGPGEPDAVITAEEEDVILVPNESGVVTQVIQSPVKHNFRTEDLSQCSQVVNSSQPVVASQTIPPIPEVVENGEDCEDLDDPDYVAHTDDSGEESDVVELRKHARKFKKKMKASEIWFAKESSGPVPIELVANVEEAVQDMEFQSANEDYSYDEDEYGQR